jgi:hypothetical protein
MALVLIAAWLHYRVVTFEESELAVGFDFLNDREQSL